jgi:hypothetical protein
MIYFNGIKLYFSLPAEKIDTLPRGRVRERGMVSPRRRILRQAQDRESAEN